MKSFPRPSTICFQLELSRPAGQITFPRSQSTRKFDMSKPFPCTCWGAAIALRRPDQVDVILTPTFHQVTGFNISAVAILPEMVCGCDWSWCEVCNYCYKHCQCADEMEYAVVAATIDGWFLKKK
jgi:hypothetical protein